MQEQLELSRQLTEKQKLMLESEDEENNEEIQDDDTTNTFGSLVAGEDNPWGIDKSGDRTVLDENNGETEGRFFSITI